MHSNSGPRRRHSDELKAKVLAACEEPSVSISGVALAHGLNANLVRKWRSGRGVKRAGMTLAPTAAIHAPPAPSGAAPEFVAVEMPAPAKPAARAQVEATAAAPIRRAADPDRASPRRAALERALADRCGSGLPVLVERAVLGPAQVIRIDQLWLCTAPMDMRAGAERLVSCVVKTTTTPS